MVALLSFLLMGIIFPLAHPLIVLLLGWKWEQAAEIFACLR